MLLAAAAGAERSDRFFQHALIELDADLAHVTGLLVAQKIAGAANVEIVARHRKPGAEIVERLQHLQAALCGVGQLLVRRAS